MKTVKKLNREDFAMKGSLVGAIVAVVLALNYLYPKEAEEIEKFNDFRENYYDIIAGYNSSVNAADGVLEIFEGGVQRNSDEMSWVGLIQSNLINLETINMRLFATDIVGDEIGLIFFYPTDSQFYTLPLTSNSELQNLNIRENNLQYYANIVDGELMGLMVETRSNNAYGLISSFYINFETLSVEDYYDYTDLLDTLRTNYSINNQGYASMIRQSNLSYINFGGLTIDNKQISTGVILDVRTSSYAIFENLNFSSIFSFQENDLIAYELRKENLNDQPSTYFGVRNVTTEEDVFIISNDERQPFNIQVMGDFVYIDNHGTIQTIYPLLENGNGNLYFEKWQIPEGFRVYNSTFVGSNAFSSSSNLLNFSINDIRDSNNQIINEYTIESSGDSIETANRIYEQLEIYFEGLGIERERVEIINDNNSINSELNAVNER